MDHRWDESTRQEHVSQLERDRYEMDRVPPPDLELVRRDRLHDEVSRRMKNLSPWQMGAAFYDQRDLYTKNGEVDERGYGLGPTIHPSEGSYASPTRAPGSHHHHVLHSDVSLFKREAWPWLNFHDMKDDPFFYRLHEDGDSSHASSLWGRIKASLAHALRIDDDAREHAREDRRIHDDLMEALGIHVDLDETDIKATVKHGIVSLEGTVPNLQSRRLAEEVAFGIRGVVDVKNRITIRHDDPTDANIAFALGMLSVW